MLDADVIDGLSERGLRIYKEFTVLITLHPSVALRPQFYDAILSGLEVFKLNNSASSLVVPDPLPSKMLADAELGANNKDMSKKSKEQANMATVMGGMAGGAAAAICLVVYNKKSRELDGGGGVVRPDKTRGGWSVSNPLQPDEFSGNRWGLARPKPA